MVIPIAEDIPGDVASHNFGIILKQTISLLSRLQMQKTFVYMLLIIILIDHFKANDILVVKVALGGLDDEPCEFGRWLFKPTLILTVVTSTPSQSHNTYLKEVRSSSKAAPSSFSFPNT